MPAIARGSAKLWKIWGILGRARACAPLWSGRNLARVGVGVDRGRLEKRGAKRRGTARAPGAEAQVAARQDMQRSGERGKESARLSCPLHTEAVPSKGFALNFSEPKHGLEERRSVASDRCGQPTEQAVLSRRCAGETSPPSCKFSCKTGEKLASLQQNCV